MTQHNATQTEKQTQSKFVIIFKEKTVDPFSRSMSLYPQPRMIEAGETMEDVMEVASRYNLKEFDVMERKGTYRIKPTINYEKV